MKLLILLLLVIPSSMFAQKGMKFEHGQNWKEIQAKAKAENKYIFLDAYTTWCGPCIYMAKNIFPLEEVGKAMNEKFINVKVQLDTTANDNEEVKSWYADGHELMTKYNIRAFPTYLFFDPNGNLVHRAVGSSTADVFIKKSLDALDPDKQFYVLLEKYKNGQKDPDFLRKVAYAAKEAYDIEYKDKLSDEYLATQTDLLTKENIEFLDRFTNQSKDAGFAVILNHPEKFDAVKGKGAANKRIVEIALREEAYPKIFVRNGPAPDWKKMSDELLKKYPKHGEEVLSNAKVIYYQSKKDWNNYQVAVVNYMKKYGESVSPEQLNNFAWTVFENCKDMKCVKEALEWSKRSFKDNNKGEYMDTYANILYKMGKKKEAIEWQEKAIAAISEDKKASYAATLEKMKKDEKTWKHD